MKQTCFKKIGPYQLQKEIGFGSFARVYKGKSEVTNEDIAVKMIQKQFLKNENQQMIEKEIDILQKLDHPSIIKLLDHKSTQNHYYLIFEFCEYGDLDNYVRKNTENGKLPELEARKIVQQIASAMEKLHSLRIVHRDLKLANILIKLADFGFAKYTEENTLLTSYCGTPITMAPEILKRYFSIFQNSNREKYNDKCDVWSVGVIIYQLIFGRAPFLPPKGGNINDLLNAIQTQELKFPEQPKISAELEELLKNMLKKDQRQRMSCIQFFSTEWVRAQQQQGIVYLKSIYKQPAEPVKQLQLQQQIHKISEDLMENELQAIHEEIISESIRDNQLKYIAQELVFQAQRFLQIQMNKIEDLDYYSANIPQMPTSDEKINEKFKRLLLSIKLLEALRLEIISEILKEQVVILQTDSSTTELITLYIKKPFEMINLKLAARISNLKELFILNQQILHEFQQQQYSVCDNIYFNIMDIFRVLIESDQLFLFKQEMFDSLMKLLQNLLLDPPLMIKAELQVFTEHEEQWHIFKLIKTYQKQISEYIEQQFDHVQTDLEKKIKFSCSMTCENEEKYISYSQQELQILKESLNDQFKSQSMLFIQ